MFPNDWYLCPAFASAPAAFLVKGQRKRKFLDAQLKLILNNWPQIKMRDSFNLIIVLKSSCFFLSFYSRNDLDVGVASLPQTDHQSPGVGLMAGPSSSARPSSGDHLLSQLLRLETAVAAGDIRRPATTPSGRSRSKMSRIEALKATATSLSNRIEYEARKLAGEGINYGTATSADMDAIFAPRPFEGNLGDGCWVETTAAENNDMELRIQRILTSTAQSLYNGTAPSGSVNLHTPRGQKEMNVGSHWTNSAVVATPILNSHTHERRKLVNGLEKPERKMAEQRGHGLIDDKIQTDLLDSSAGSISEGPLLSEGSFSDGETSPPHFPASRVPRPAEVHLEEVEYCAGRRRDYQRLPEFQKEAARFSPFSSPFAHHNGSRSAWEELNKGSPLSVINIFTKNLHGHVKGQFTGSGSLFVNFDRYTEPLHC